MKLATCEINGRSFAAVVRGDMAYEAAPDMMSLIEALEEGREPELKPPLPLSSLRLLAPIPRPRQDVLCLGMNYADHSVEAANWGKEAFVKNEGKAVFFSKRATYIIGPGMDIDGHFDIVDGLDYESELAVVLGRDAYKVKYEDAFEYVLGYSVFNDVSARNLQRDNKQWYFGKSLDTHSVMGPWIVTRDELPQPPEVNIGCLVNGEERQRSNTRFMLRDIPYVISTLSAGMTLSAGTIIAMGTPAGVGMGFDPPRYLAAGDRVKCYIECIGELENTII